MILTRTTNSISGVTTITEWNQQMKNRAAPWTEIEIPGQIIFTAPTQVVANKISDIFTLGKTYESLMLSVNKFAGLEKRFRPERVVFDVQIEIGNTNLNTFKSLKFFN